MSLPRVGCPCHRGYCWGIDVLLSQGSVLVSTTVNEHTMWLLKIRTRATSGYAVVVSRWFYPKDRSVVPVRWLDFDCFSAVMSVDFGRAFGVGKIVPAVSCVYHGRGCFGFGVIDTRYDGRLCRNCLDIADDDAYSSSIGMACKYCTIVLELGALRSSMRR